MPVSANILATASTFIFDRSLAWLMTVVWMFFSCSGSSPSLSAAMPVLSRFTLSQYSIMGKDAPAVKGTVIGM